MKMNYAQMAEGFIQIPKEKWTAVQAELTALREKYSTPCEDCEGFHASEITSCPKCHGTRRVMMLDAEGVKAESIEKDDDDEIDDGWKGAMKRVLKGEGGKK
jgi:Zn finger protein HypA/HybF involved in hydrogenase expression